MRDLNNANPLKQQLLKSVRGLEGWFKSLTVEGSLTVGGIPFGSIVADLTGLIRTVAYVNFDRTTPADVSASYTQSGTAVTVTSNNHNHKIGHFVFCDSFTGGSATGGFIITGVLDANRFTYTSTSSLTTSGTLLLKRSTVRSSKNIHSVYSANSVGLTYVNLDIALPNTNYVTQYTAGNLSFNQAATPIGDGNVIGQTTLYLALTSYATNGAVYINFPYNAVTIVQ